MINIYKRYTANSVQNNLNRNMNKTDDVNKYFRNLVMQHPNVNLAMCSGFKNVDGQVNLCISPEYIKKAMHDSKAAENIEHEINNMPDTVAYIQSHCTFPSGKKVKSVSFCIKPNGKSDMYVECEEPKNKKVSSTNNDKEKFVKNLKQKIKSNKLKNVMKNLNNPYMKNYYDNTSDMYGLNFLNRDV